MATCGTSFGDDHARILRRLLRDQDEFRGEIIFTFDGDAAGQKAAMRAFDGDQRFVGQTFVAIEPGGLDPCELRQRSGDVAVRELVARRQPLFHFAIRTVLGEFDLDNLRRAARCPRPHGARGRADPRSCAARRVRPQALRMGGGTGRARRRPTMRALAGAPDRGRGRLRGPTPPPDPRQRTLGVPVHGDVDPQTLGLERDVLRVAVQRPALAGPAFDDLDPEAFLSPAYRALREAILKAGGCATQGGGQAWADALVAAASDDATRNLVAELSVEPAPADDASLPRYVESVVLRLHEVWVSRSS